MEGDIRALEKDVRQYLKEVMGERAAYTGQCDHHDREGQRSLRYELKDWLVSKGF